MIHVFGKAIFISAIFAFVSCSPGDLSKIDVQKLFDETQQAVQEHYLEPPESNTTSLAEMYAAAGAAVQSKERVQNAKELAAILKKKPGSEGRIQSLERAFAVLEETARHKNGISLSDLSRKLNLHTSTLYHLTKTLTSLGYLGMGDNKRYRVGRSIYQLASKCFDDIDLTATCQPFLERLAFETGESSHFAVWEKKNVFLMSRVSGTNSLQLNEGAGTMRPIHCSASGKGAHRGRCFR